MTQSFTQIKDLGALLVEIPEDSIVSRAVFSAAGTKVILFGFAPGQELSEHTAARPALLHFLRGEAELTLGGETTQAGPGTFVHMVSHLPHSVHARTEVLMLLTLLPQAETDPA